MAFYGSPRAKTKDIPIEDMSKVFECAKEGGLITKIDRINSPKGSKVGSVKADGYLEMYFEGRKYYVHRVVWALSHGAQPNCIDHINGDRKDNRIENLRSTSHRENIKSGYDRRAAQ